MQPLKIFGLGILWALLFPFIVVGAALVGAFGTINFLIEFGIMVINFFRGKKLFPLYPEDQKAYEVLQKAIDKKNAQSDAALAATPQPQQVFVQQNFYTTPGSLPPGVNPNQIPPNYNAGQLPPSYTQVPGNTGYPQPNAIPQQPVPQRPELASLPQFDASQFDNETHTIEIDIDEGGTGND